MRLLSIPGLMSICIMLTHSSRFILYTGSIKILNQVWQSGSKTSKAPDGSQSSQSTPKPPKASGTSATHAQSQRTPSTTLETDSYSSTYSEDCSQDHSESTPVTPVAHPSYIKIFTEDSSSPNDSTHHELKKYDNFYKFEFKEQVKCVGLKNPDQFPTSLFLHLESKRVYLALKDSLFVYTYQDNKWTETEANLVQLDIGKKESNSNFEFSKKDNIGIYTAKTNILFQEVIWKKGSLNCGSDYTFIQATDPGQYVYKVVRDGTDLTKSASNVNLYLINGDIKKFHKVSSGRCKKSWSEVEPKPQGSDGTTNNNSSHKFVKKRSLGKILEFKFEIKDQVKCIGLKYNEDFICKQEINSNYPKAMHLCNSGFLFLLEMEDDKFLLLGLTSDNKWESESLTGVNDLSESNIKIITKDADNNTKENDTSKYDFEKLSFGLEYKFKDDAECVEIKYNDINIWNYDSVKNTNYPSFIYVLSRNVLVFL